MSQKRETPRDATGAPLADDQLDPSVAQSGADDNSPTPPARPGKPFDGSGGNRAGTGKDGRGGALQVALRYAKLGWSVFPLKDHGKTPRTKHGFKDATTDPDQIRRWWKRWPRANIGLLAQVGVLVLDLDRKDGVDGFDSINSHAPPGGELSPGTYPGPWAETPNGGGAHVVMRWPDGVPPPSTRAGRLPGVDLRGLARAYIVVSPSVTEDGSYRWINSLCPMDELPEAPRWIVDLLKPAPPKLRQTAARPAASTDRDLSPYLNAALQSACDCVRSAARGERNQNLNSESFTLGQLEHAGLDRSTAEGELIAAAVAAGLGDPEAVKTFASGWTSGEKEPRNVPEREHDRTRTRDTTGGGERNEPAGRMARYEDLYNARRLARENAQRLMFCGNLGGWFAWDSCRWQRSENHAEQEAAGELAAVMLAEADARLSEAEGAAESAADKAKTSPQDTKAAAAKNRAESALAVAKAERTRAKRAQARRGIESMLALARSEPTLAVAHTAVDADAWVLNCLNGVLDLRTNNLRPHNPEDRLTKVAGCDYVPAARAPQWHAFLERILPDPDVRSFVQRLVGYALTSVIRDHILPIFYGVGANGKSVLVGALQAVLGDYAGTLPAEVVAPIKHGEQHPTGRARLRGLRFAVASESDQMAQLAVATIKALTGGDRIVARFMRQDFFEFDPTHKLVLVTNHRPRVTDPGDAIWRRVLLIPFEVQIPEAEQDRDLPDKLRGELPGILRWAVEGCREWQRDGLATPDRIKAATAEYRAAEDTLGEFIAERLEAEPQALTLAKDLHTEYRDWAEGVGAHAVGTKRLYAMLDERGYSRGPKRSGGVTFVGLRVRGAHLGLSETNQQGRITRQHSPGDGGGAVTEISLIGPVEEKQSSLYGAYIGVERHNTTSVTPGDDLPGDSEQGEPVGAAVDATDAKVRL